MTGKYATPQAFKAALEQRLRTRAAGDGLELQRLRQLVVFDRFLARVFLELDDAVVLKGGLVIELRLARARTTKDVDLRIVGRPDDALERLRSAGRRDLGDHLAFLVAPDPRHPTIEVEGLVYEGLRFVVEGRLADKVYGRPFGVDVAFAEPMTGEPEALVAGDWLRFAGIEPGRYRVYPLESHVAEKLHAYTMPRLRPNSRVKDLPDLALLAMVRPMRAELLREALRRTWEHRGTHPLPSALPAPPEGWELPYEEIARANDLPWRSLDEVLGVVRRFIDPVLAGEQGVWSAEAWGWTPGAV